MGRSAWIISPAGDMTFLIASPLAIVPIVSWLSNVYFSAEQISLAVVSFASIGHHLPGFMRAYGDRDLFQRFRWRFLLAPPLVLAVALLFAWHNFQALTLVLLFWATWHVLMQTYGFMRIYDLKQGQTSAAAARLDFLLCLCVFAVGVVFSDARVYGIAEVLWNTGFPFFGPNVLKVARIALAGATGLVFAAYLVQMIRWRSRGVPINWIKLLLVLSTGWLYWTSGLISQDILIGVALFEIFHALQYNAIVWVYNCGATRRDQKSLGVLSLLFQDRLGFLCVYLAAIVAYGLLNIGAGHVTPSYLQQIARACLVTSTLLHFYYDGFIWKVSEARSQANLAINCPSSERRVPRAFWHPVALATLVLFAFLWEAPSSQSSDGRQASILSHLYALTPALPEVQSRIAREELAQGNSAEAIRLAKNVVRLRPKSQQAHADLGVALLRSGDYAGAAESFKSAIELNPSIWQNHGDLGTAYAHLKDWDAAERSHTRAVELQPDNSQNHVNLGVARLNRAEVNSAHASFEQAILLDADNVNAHFQLGNLQQMIGMLDDAAKSYRRCIDLQPNYAEAYANLGVIFAQQADPVHAEAAYRRALAIAPDSAATNYNLGLLLFTTNRTTEAAAYFRQAKALGQEVPAELLPETL